MSLGTIRDELRLETGGRLDIDDLIDTKVNEALQEFATMYEFEQLMATATTPTVDGQSHYLLPSDLYVLWLVKEETRLNRELEQKDIRLFDHIDETKTGVPNFFSQYNNQLILWNQVPDDNDGDNYSIRIRYWRRQAELSDDNDDHLLPAEWERGVKLKAGAYLFNSLDMDEKAAAKQQELDRWMGRIKLPGGARRERNKRARLNLGGPGY